MEIIFITVSIFSIGFSAISVFIAFRMIDKFSKKIDPKREFEASSKKAFSRPGKIPRKSPIFYEDEELYHKELKEQKARQPLI